MQINVKKLNKEAKLPLRAHHGDAGMDFFSNEEVIIKADDYYAVKTGVSIEIPYSYVGLIWDKSGLANKGIKTVGGVVDSGYRGEVMIQLRNFSQNDYKIEKGDKVAQMLIQKVELPIIVEAEDLSQTERADGRFGSTGIK